MSANDLALSVRGLSKAYTIAHQKGEKHSTLAEQMLARFRKPFQRSETETFWALKDVSFDIKKGDVVGIIGRNGAGKSTLLKILSRITEPTAGEVDLYGRVGSLLEVGTGFHPELTGRENIYLNGNILGMSRAEITKQFDAIVDFAGVEKFLDTPVKRYSSGMYVRLAFAVAAHLESEILVVDEVLAVGDSEFQRKCLGKLRDVATGGRTVFFVSHSMQSVQQLCNTAMLLRSGRVVYSGNVEHASHLYKDSFTLGSRAATGTNARRPGTGEFRIAEFVPAKLLFDPGEVKMFEITVLRTIDAPPAGAYLNISIMDSSGQKITVIDSRTSGLTLSQDQQKTTFTIQLFTPWLKPGDYWIDAKICNFGTVDLLEGACQFAVSELLPYSHLADSLAYEGAALGNYSVTESQ